MAGDVPQPHGAIAGGGQPRAVRTERHTPDPVEAIGDAIGEPIRFLEQTRDEARTQMLRFIPEAMIDTILDVLGEPNPLRSAPGLPSDQ